MTANITRARPEDAEAVKVLEKENGLSPWTIADYRREADRQASVFLVARERQEPGISGFLIMRLIMASESLSSGMPSVLEAELLNFCVRYDLRRTGLGRALFLEAIRDILLVPESRIFLEVRESNEAARAFYTSLGFVETGRRAQFYRAPVEDAVTMKLAGDKLLAKKTADAVVFEV